MISKPTKIKIDEVIEFFKNHNETFCLMFVSAKYISITLHVEITSVYRVLKKMHKKQLIKFKTLRHRHPKRYPTKFYYLNNLNKEPPQTANT